MDIKTIFVGLGFIISIFSLWLSISAKREARETKLIELVHQKRMLLTTHFSEVQRIVNALRGVNFENDDLKKSYEQLSQFRGQLINAMNDSELSANPKELNKEFIYNQISDFNLLISMHKSDLHDLEKYLERNT